MIRDIYDVINNHKSVRKYKRKTIPDDVMERILTAGTRASSSGNMQAYSIIVTKDEAIKKELLPHHFDQNMVLEAPALITFCSDFNRMRMWLKESNAPENFDNFMSFLIGMIDATIASQNVALAAEAEGLGICYMGTTLASNNEISKILSLPQHVVPVVGFSIGYPAEYPEKKDRLPLNAIVHQEKYQNYSSSQIMEIYSEKEIKGMQRYKANTDLRKSIEDLGIENLANIYTKLKYTKESHIEYSNNVLDCLKQQGFLH
jgi:nitroreductase